MKSIVVDIDEKDLYELGISTDRISLDELEKRIMIQSLRKHRNALEKLNIEYGFNKLSEDEIFNMVNEDKADYNNKQSDKH